MGTSLQLCIAQRAQRINKSSKMKIFVIAALLAAVSAEPGYGYYGQHSWPAAFGHGYSRMCYGCRGKRSADPEADPHYYGLGYYGLGYGLGLYGPGIAGHPGAATSFVARSPQGIGQRSADAEPHYPLGKRSADAEADPHYYGLGGYYG